jgi:hypothetical protein
MEKSATEQEHVLRTESVPPCRKDAVYRFFRLQCLRTGFFPFRIGIEPVADFPQAVQEGKGRFKLRDEAFDLAVGDGAPGFRAAVEERGPTTCRQR